MRMAEAALLLVVAQLLIATVRFGVWRRWVGEVDRDAVVDRITVADTEGIETVTRAVRRADRRRRYRCLPRAMATHWMLARRGIDSRLRIGVLPRGDHTLAANLHAWVEVGSRIVMGEHAVHDYRAALTLATGRPER